MQRLETTTCKRAPVRLYAKESAFQLGKLLRVDVSQSTANRAYHFAAKDNVPAIWLAHADALCWIERGKKTGKKPVRNTSDQQDASDLFYEWHQRLADKEYTVNLTGNVDGWEKVGAVLRIDYQSDKWSGKLEEYTHEVSRGTTLYLADLGHGERLWLCKGKLKVTGRGLVN